MKATQIRGLLALTPLDGWRQRLLQPALQRKELVLQREWMAMMTMADMDPKSTEKSPPPTPKSAK